MGDLSDPCWKTAQYTMCSNAQHSGAQMDRLTMPRPSSFYISFSPNVAKWRMDAIQDFDRLIKEIGLGLN